MRSKTGPILFSGTGEIIVDVVATRVLNYMHEVLSGARGYQIDLPIVPGPGAIGRVRAYGPDATHIQSAIGSIAIPPCVRATTRLKPDITLQGLIARGEGGLRLQKYYRDGAWAEQMRLPTENATRIGEIDAADAPRWCAMGTYARALWRFAGRQSFSPAKRWSSMARPGNFGSSAVAVALAMGAGKVIATGRNKEVLADLERRFGARVRTVADGGR